MAWYANPKSAHCGGGFSFRLELREAVISLDFFVLDSVGSKRTSGRYWWIRPEDDTQRSGFDTDKDWRVLFSSVVNVGISINGCHE